MSNNRRRSPRLLLVVSTIFKGRGGIPRFNQLLCRSLDELATEIGFVGTVVSVNDAIADYRAQGAPWKNLRFVAGGGKCKAAVYALLASMRERPDLLLIGHIGMTPVGLACAPFLSGGYGFLAYGTEVWDVPRWTRRFSARRASFAIVISNNTGALLAQATGFDHRRLRLLPCALDSGLAALDDRDDVRTNEHGHELLSVARLWASERKKGIDDVLEVVRRIAYRYPGLRYRIIGKGDDKQRLVNLAESLGITDRVIFEEDLSDEELADRYRRCSIFILPSGQEGFGIVFLEAMRFGKVCIGGHAGGTSEVISDGQTGLLVPFADPDALEKGLDRLLAEPELREAMGEKGRTRVSEEFTFEKYKDRLGGHLRELLSGNGHCLGPTLRTCSQ